MLSKRYAVFASIALLAAVTVSFSADDDAKKSDAKPSDDGPVELVPQGYIPGAFHPVNVTGNWAGKPHCLVCEHGLHPVAMVLVRDWPDNEDMLGTLFQKLDASVEKDSKSQLRGFGVFFGGPELAQKVVALAKTKDLKNISLAIDQPDSASGIKRYKLPDAAVTVVLYHNHKIAHVIKLAKDGLTEEAIDKVIGQFNALVGDKKAS
jgi:hypothetical protein